MNFIFFNFYKMPYKYNIIEAKHRYQMLDSNYYLSRANGDIFDSECVKCFQLEYPGPGENENMRIGNKINNVSLRIEYNVSPRDYRFYLLPSNLTTAADPNFYMKFRMMIVDIPDEANMTSRIASEYFQDMFTFTYNNATVQSNHTKSLRVSGPNVGNFKILYDEPFIIDCKHPFHHKVINLNLINTLLFKENQDNPQNHNYYIWFIMPKYYNIDVSTAVKEQIATLFELPIDFRANIKLTWFDN